MRERARYSTIRRRTLLGLGSLAWGNVKLPDVLAAQHEQGVRDSALVSGGGVLMGQAIGATNSKAEYPAERI